MGYQESYVTTGRQSDFDKMVNLIKELGSSWFEGIGVMPVGIITLTKKLEVNLANMCKPHINCIFSEGTRFMYFAGDRNGQRNPQQLFGERFVEGTEIFFTECFPSKQIFMPNSSLAFKEPFFLQ